MHVWRRRVLICALAGGTAALLFAGTVELGGSLPGPLPLFPPSNWWNADISNAPVDPNSAAYISFVNNGSPRPLHPDFGGDAAPGSVETYGYPYIVVGGDQPKKTVQFEYGDESDGVNHATGESIPFYPIPDEAATRPHWIEGGPPGSVDLRSSADRHMILVDRDNRHLYELYNVFFDGTRWHAGSGAFFDMKTNARRPEGWTSSDAAGLAILPGLVRYEEVYGEQEIDHAFRVTVRATNGYVYPASHRAGNNSRALPMGARLRLKAGVNLSGFPPELQRLFRAFKKHGLIVADNGSDMYISGTYDTRWVNGAFNADFRKINASDFEIIQLGYHPPQLAYFPHVAMGGGFTTAVTLVNTGAGDASGNLVVTAANGAPSNPLPVSIPSGGVKILELGGAAESITSTGWARFESFGGSVAGLATFQFREAGVLKTSAGVFACAPISSATILVDNDEEHERYTGFAVANPGAAPASISITVRDETGRPVSVLTPPELNPLGAGRQLAAFLHEFFAGARTMKGSMTLAGADGGTFVVVALIQDHGLYTAVPVQ